MLQCTKPKYLLGCDKLIELFSFILFLQLRNYGRKKQQKKSQACYFTDDLLMVSLGGIELRFS